MADSTLNRFLARGTNAARIAFTPSPPTPSSGPSPTYIWYATDTANTYAWDGSAWQLVNNASGSVTTTGSPASGNLAKFSGTSSVTNGDLSGDVTTSGTLATTIANSAVTLAKIANASANSKLLGSGASGSGSAYAELTLGTNLSMSGTTLNAAGGGWALAGTGQTATGIWDQAVDGSKATVDFAGLTGTDIMIIVRNVTQANSGVICARVSVDNGSTFYASSGDYVGITAAGVESNNAYMGAFHSTNATAARSGVMLIPGAGVSGPPKVSQVVLVAAETRYFVASSSAINAVRILPSGGGNLTGGKIWVLTR